MHLQELWGGEGSTGEGLVVVRGYGVYASSAQRRSRRGISSPACFLLPSNSRFHAQYSPKRSSA